MRKKVLFLLILVVMLSLSVNAQRGVRIAYIDTEYILEKVPEYQDAMLQLDEKAQKWKNEIQGKLSEIAQKRKDLSNEKALLTNELIEEREEDITFEEKEILDYQQKRFGPNGDLMIQRNQLMQPIQDQIFSAVQTMAETRKYDFIFDKSADLVMLFSAKRHDISEHILRTITRSSKRKQAKTKAERKTAKQEELVPEINEDLEERQKILEEKKAERESAVEKRRQEILAAREAKKKEALERREKLLAEREKAKQAKLDSRSKTTDKVEEAPKESDKEVTEETSEKPETETKTRAQLIEENRQKKLKEREARKKELEERKKKILEERAKNKSN